MRKLFAVLALTFGFAALSNAQNFQIGGVQLVPLTAVAVSNSTVAVDTEPALVIKYYPGAAMGSGAITPTVANVAATSMTFTVNGAAYTGFEAPVSSTLGGVIALNDASASDLGEVVDIINSTPITFPTGYFRAVIVNGFRSDVSVDLLTDAADTDVSSVLGEIIYHDTSEVLFSDGTLVDYNALSSSFFGPRGLAVNPFEDTQQVLYSSSSQETNGGTIVNLTVYAVKRTYGSGKDCVATATCGPNAGSSETSRVLWIEAAGATTARGAADELKDAGGFRSNPGEFLMWRRTHTGAASTVIANFTVGLQFQNR
jgi:hypothetical protein